MSKRRLLQCMCQRGVRVPKGGACAKGRSVCQRAMRVSKGTSPRKAMEVMGKVSPKRLLAGGFIGPVAAFLYCVGFYHIIFISNENVKGVAIAAFLFSCLGIIAGGAYHSHCAYLGLLAKDKYKDARNIVMQYFQKMILIVYIAEGIGFVLLAGIIVTGNSILPRWVFWTSPLILMLLKPLVVRLPKGVRVIVSGGWSNLISVIYYAVAIGCAICIL